MSEVLDRDPSQLQHMGEVLDRDPSQLQVTTLVRELPSSPGQQLGFLITERTLEHLGPVVMPREYERGECLAMTARGVLRDRGSCRGGQLADRRRCAGSIDRQWKTTISEDLPGRAHVP